MVFPKNNSITNQQDVQQPVYITNGEVVNDDNSFRADVYIDDGIIKYVGPADNFKVPPGARIIDARGKYVLPGGIDPHTHLEMVLGDIVTVDDFYYGTRAAIAGGTTTIIDFILPARGESLVSAYKKYRSRADPKACCDFAFHMALTWWSPSVAEEMKEICKLGVNSFKIYMAYKDVLQLNDTEMLDAFEHIRALKALAQVHAENGDIIARNETRLLEAGINAPHGHQLARQEEVEAEAVHRACILANQVDCPLYVVHVMSKSAGIELARARQRYAHRGGVFGETLAAALGTDGSHYQHECFHHAAGHVMSPPLRPDTTTPEFMMKLLANDDLQLTGSDNCTYNREHKELGKEDFTKIPNGVNGVEDRMSVVWEKGVHAGLLDPCRFVAVTSTNAAKIFNLYPQKGRIAVGSDADVVIWNPNATRTISKDTHHHACDFNIFEGMTCHGVPETVLVRGRICVENRVVNVRKGHGRFLVTPVRAPYVYDQLESQQKTIPHTNDKK